MKRVLIVSLFILSIAGLIGQGLTFTASEDGLTISVISKESSGSTETVAKVNDSGEVIKLITHKLETLQKDYISKFSKPTSRSANNIIQDIYSLLALLPENANITITEHNQPTPTNTTVNININDYTSTIPTSTTNSSSMSDSDFEKLISRIDNESFSDDQLRVVRTASKSQNFKVTQIVRILDCFSFADDKLSALSLAYRGCVDPQNSYQILDAFTYSSDKSRAERIIDAN